MKGMNSMYNPYETYPYPYFFNPQRYMRNAYRTYQCPCMMNMPMYAQNFPNEMDDDRYIPFTNNMHNNINNNMNNNPNNNIKSNMNNNIMNNNLKSNNTKPINPKPINTNPPMKSNLKPDSFKGSKDNNSPKSKDYGPEPFAINIEEATKENKYYRSTLWTGKHYQLTLMSIDPGDDIGLEVHPDVDQFLRIEEGQGIVKMGNSKKHLDFQMRVRDGFAIFVPAGTWHNLINTGKGPLKLYSIYAPPQHPHGTLHKTKADAQAAGD